MNMNEEEFSNLPEDKDKTLINQESKEESKEESEEESKEESKEEEETKMKGDISLQLGDVIKIIAPTNDEIHESTNYITYIDNTNITIINVATFHQSILTINKSRLNDESIKEIQLLYRNEETGFARQNMLLPGTWIQIHFGGDFPLIINGEITNLDEDMIEITTFPELQVLYINFGYKGIPPQLSIEEILIKEKPESLKNIRSLTQLKEGENIEDLEDISQEDMASMVFTDTGESIIEISKDAVPEEDIRQELENLYLESSEIIFGKKLQKIAHLVEIPESEQRYSIDTQVADLTDEILSTIPSQERTFHVLENIHRLIERFKELRNDFSRVDANENVIGYKKFGEFHKPLVEALSDMKHSVQWIIPIVSNRKKVYDIYNTGDDNEIIFEETKNIVEEIINLQADYYNKKIRMNNDDFIRIQRRIDDILTSFEPPLTYKESEIYIKSDQVLTPIEAIVENMDDDYMSQYITLMPNSGIKKSKAVNIYTKKFATARYTPGQKYLTQEKTRSGKINIQDKLLTPNDIISIKSILVLPEPIVHFSKTTLSQTSILERATLHTNYFLLYRLLQKNLEIENHRIDNKKKEIEYKENTIDAETETEREREREPETETDIFLSGIHRYTLDNSIYNKEHDAMKLLLSLIIPNTKSLLHNYRPWIQGRYSFQEIVKELEPFYIYTNNITYKQFQEIRYYINLTIKKLKAKFSETKKDYFELIDRKYTVQPIYNTILRLFKENPKYQNVLQDKYGIRETDSPTEIVSKFFQIDHGLLYTTLVNSIFLPLMAPNNLLDTLQKPKVDDITDIEKIKPAECARRFLTKKYSSLGELQKDNNKDSIYYDKDFDDTPYSISDKYRAEKKKLPADLFHEFLKENLLEKHDCPKEMADEMATTLINGKKLIRDGEYCILEIRPHLVNSGEGDDDDGDKFSESDKKNMELESDLRKKISYYRRLKNQWVLDESIGSESFLDNNTIFCNISELCFKNAKNTTCEPLADDSRKRLQESTRTNIMKEFENRISLTMEEMESKIRTELDHHLNRLVRRRELTKYQQYKNNQISYQMGTQSQHYDMIISPHLNLRTFIMGQDDFIKKQGDICKFVDKYCRKPMIAELEESPHWLYCMDTNVRLLPLSCYLLAKSFMEGKSPLYLRTLNQLSHTLGEISDDGDSIVDKHTGFVLRKIDFATEEGYDENGFRIQTNDTLEDEISGSNMVSKLMEKGTIMSGSKSKTNQKRVFEDENSEIIYNVLSAIATNIDIEIEGIESFVLRITNQLNHSMIDSEASYMKRLKIEAEKKGKISTKSYISYRNERIIFNTACVLFVAIQTAIPSFQTKKSFSNCFSSFEGYPLGGVEDITGITYITCVILQMRSSIAPWDSVGKYKTEALALQLKKNIENLLKSNSDIEIMMEKKKEYLVDHQEKVMIDKEISLGKWIHFMPPIIPFSIVQKMRPVSTDFDNEFMTTLKKGNKNQFDMYHVLQGKIAQYGFSVIEMVNKIVANENLVLKTNSGQPFMENNCCNQTAIVRPIQYFNEIDKNIEKSIHIVDNISHTMMKVKELSKASLIYDPRITNLLYPSVPEGYLEEIAYTAIIHYCRLDSPVSVPIPEEFHVFLKDKPAEYNRLWNTAEKVEFMKKHGKQYHMDDLLQLMRIVNTKNLVTIDMPPLFTKIDRLKDVLQSLETNDSAIIGKPLRDLFSKLLSVYNPSQFTNELSPELTELQKHLYNSNNRMYYKIMDFFDKLSNVSPSEYNKINEFLYTIIECKDPQSQLTTLPKLIQNMVFSISKVYPTILTNNGNFFRAIPYHWAIAHRHYLDIYKFLEKYYTKIEAFKHDNVLHRVFSKITDSIADVNLFLDNIPIFTDIEKKVNGKPTTFFHFLDRTTILLLHSYSLYSLLDEYITASQDPDILNVEIQEVKNMRREQIRDNGDESLLLGSNSVDVDYHDEDANETEMGLREVKITVEESKGLQQRIGSLLMVFMEIEKENKDAIDVTYEEIMRKVSRNRQKEKNRIIDTLGKMSIEERKYENVMKNLRLGHWNVGQQKGLYKYDKETYTRERDEMDYMELVEHAVGEEEEVVVEGEEEEGLDIDADQEDENALDINGLDSEYYDGNYYEEDKEDDGLYEG
jgi:hypothetical protein